MPRSAVISVMHGLPGINRPYNTNGSIRLPNHPCKATTAFHKQRELVWHTRGVGQCKEGTRCRFVAYGAIDDTASTIEDDLGTLQGASAQRVSSI